MWDLNGSPDDHMNDEESEGCSSLNDDKGKRVDGSVSNSSSSAVDCSADDDGAKQTIKKRSSKIFGFSFTHQDSSLDSAEAEAEADAPVTRQFMPVDDDGAGDGATARSAFAGPHWAGLKFSQSEVNGEANGGGGKSAEVVSSATSSQPMIKKSRRGPRSRSSQYRGVTFYRRTGRWESHIW